MKRIILFTACLLTALFSCVPPLGDVSGKGFLNFGSVSGARAASISDVNAAYISVVRASDGAVILNNRRISLTLWPDGSFTSESVPLEPGTYYLTQFILVDAADRALFATPVAGSPMAMLVTQPLPIGFSIALGATTNLNPEVLDVSNNTPQAFGYLTFDFRVITTNCTNIQVTYNAGPDGTWFSADDTCASYLYSGRIVSLQSTDITFGDAGADGLWFTPDDEVSGYAIRSRDATNREIQRIEYAGAGPDGIWLTADDEIFRYRTYSYNANGKILLETRYGKGPDGIWFTADDLIIAYSASEYPTSDTRLHKYHENPGPDGLWFTADDVVYDYYSENYDIQGLRISRQRFLRGADGIALTADDVMDHRETYTYSTTKKLIMTMRFQSKNTPDPSDDALLYYINQINL